MLINERKERLLSLLVENGTMTTSALASELYVSEATIRRDLKELERLGQVNRVHGGAEPLQLSERQIPLTKRENQNELAKQNIAAKAVKLIHDGNTIFLDASSTVRRIVPLLGAFSGLTVVTNSPKTVLELADMGIRTISTGGILLNQSIAFVGRNAEQVIRSINADIMFFSCRGVSDDGDLCDSSLDETSIRREMLLRAKVKCLCCDSRKFGNKYPFNICRIEDIDHIITERS